MTRLSKKICLLGDFAVGKTSLVRRFVHNKFDDKYLSTIGVKVSRKTVTIPRAGELVELSMLLWDLAGSEEFDRVKSSYLRGAAGAVLVCDLTRPETLGNLSQYANGYFKNNPQAQLILAANKSDLIDQQELTESEVEAAAQKMNIPYYLTSAKTGDEVEQLFKHIGQLLLA
ncbi:MAG: GTP-binding protein [Chloroflexi bacterium]|nr:MAG: GTP-binding protein [Chloroflexota bacterium]